MRESGLDDFGDGETELQRNPVIRVHDLSEFVFCPRAGLIARESSDEESAEDPPDLGPKLGSFWDYSEHRFNDEILLAWGRLRMWVTLSAPTMMLVSLLGRFISPMAAAIGAIPLGFFLAHVWLTLQHLFILVRHRSAFRNAALDLPDFSNHQITQVNWWTLRKAGFDCWKPELPYHDPDLRLSGKPWRVLTQGVRVRIPVFHKHRGESRLRPQHIVKLMAYCRLLEVCEGSESPFGILMFNDSDDCILIPNVSQFRQQFENALKGFRRLLSVKKSEGLIPGIPDDHRCYGCHRGEPRLYVPQLSETILDGIVRPPVVAGKVHSTCGDRFGWIPPHEQTLLRQVQ